MVQRSNRPFLLLEALTVLLLDLLDRHLAAKNLVFRLTNLTLPPLRNLAGDLIMAECL